MLAIKFSITVMCSLLLSASMPYIASIFRLNTYCRLSGHALSFKTGIFLCNPKHPSESWACPRKSAWIHHRSRIASIFGAGQYVHTMMGWDCCESFERFRNQPQSLGGILVHVRHILPWIVVRNSTDEHPPFDCLLQLKSSFG